MIEFPKLTPTEGGIMGGELVYIGCGTGGRSILHDTDLILHCTGVVTEYEIQELKKRIASGMTTADDVVLLEKVLEYAKDTTTG